MRNEFLATFCEMRWASYLFIYLFSISCLPSHHHHWAHHRMCARKNFNNLEANYGWQNWDVHSSGWNVQFWSCGGSGLLVVLKSWQTALVFGEANRMTRAQPGERFCWQGNTKSWKEQKHTQLAIPSSTGCSNKAAGIIYIFKLFTKLPPGFVCNTPERVREHRFA